MVLLVLGFSIRTPRSYLTQHRLLTMASIPHLPTVLISFGRAGIAQSVYRLATGWTVRGSNPSGDEIFRTRPDRPWAPPSLLYNVYRVFPEGKTAVVWCWPPTPSNAEVKERVELHFHSPSGPSWSILGWILPLILSLLISFGATYHAHVGTASWMKRWCSWLAF
jgi:hypothetical protein